MSSVVNFKMFIYLVLILSNCLTWSAIGGVTGTVFATSISVPKPKSSTYRVGDLTETRKFAIADTFSSDKGGDGVENSATSTPSSMATPPTTTSANVAASAVETATTSSVSSSGKQDFVLFPSVVAPAPPAAATGSASSRFNVDLRRSSVSSTGAIQSPTTFIGGSGGVGAGGHHQIRRKPQQLSSSSLSATKSVFEEKSKYEKN